MKTLIQVYREGKWYVAVDLVTNVADQGKTEGDALYNLKKGLEEHYKLLMAHALKNRKTAFLDLEVERYVQTPSPVC